MLNKIYHVLKRGFHEDTMNLRSLNLHHGEEIKVQTENEILVTLDEEGTLEGLPFMPEMRKYCGRRFKVLKHLDKLIIEGVGVARIKNTVILEGVTCNGEAYDGCQRSCPILWKEAWLERVCNNSEENDSITRVGTSSDLNRVYSNKSSCQSINLAIAASPLSRWDFRQYVWDIKSRSYGPLERLRYLLTSLSYSIQKLLLGRQSALAGRLRVTPNATLNLQLGDLVEVKRKEEIIATLDTRGRNRGLEFTPEMLKYCGKRFRVYRRLDKMVNEKTKAMRPIADTVLLEGVTCDGKAHGGCPRTCYCLWREIWLKRVRG
jgi:hypothetical protein